ncbi:PGF-CTERM sorting domain-containing protein [Natrialbaceae archaeon A-arb3/5]
MLEPRPTVPVRIAVLLVAGLVVSGLAAGVLVASTGATITSAQETAVSEEEYVEPVPGPDDEYFEAVAEDDSWISYINPRDEYRMPYLGDGSGKLCVTLLNEAGEPVVGETVPGTTVTVPTGDELEWHDDADPMTVEYPLTDNYDRPLDADQFGTSSELPQGDGYLDSHCIEMHGLPEDETVEYGEVEIEGEHADQIELVGYIQQAHDSWDTSVDPIEDAESYEAAGGGWTFEPDGSHGQAVVVLQLDGDVDGTEMAGENGQDGSDSDGDAGNETDGSMGGGDDRTAGFGVLVALSALLVAVLVRANRSSR